MGQNYYGLLNSLQACKLNQAPLLVTCGSARINFGKQVGVGMGGQKLRNKGDICKLVYSDHNAIGMYNSS